VIYVIVAVACLLVGWYGNEASRRIKTTEVYGWYKARVERRDRREKQRMGDG
jgi:hypothetical protein